MEQDKIQEKIAEYAEMKALSHTYAIEVQDRYIQVYNLFAKAGSDYASQKNNVAKKNYEKMAYSLSNHSKEYTDVRKQYNIAAARFEKIRASLKIYLINNNHLPEEDSFYSSNDWTTAKSEYEKFVDLVIGGDGQSGYLSLKLVIDPPADSSVKLVGAEEYIISFVLPVVSKIFEIQKAAAAEKQAKRDKLISAIDEFLKWDEWGTIEKSK